MNFGGAKVHSCRLEKNVLVAFTRENENEGFIYDHKQRKTLKNGMMTDYFKCKSCRQCKEGGRKIGRMTMVDGLLITKEQICAAELENGMQLAVQNEKRIGPCRRTTRQSSIFQSSVFQVD